MNTYCLDCGALTKVTKKFGSRCPECWGAWRRAAKRLPNKEAKRVHGDRGYNWKWRKLSEKARKLQPFCSVCGSTSDLQTDHTPEAWRRHEQGLAIRLQDVRVLCGDCNRRAGEARPGSARYRRAEQRTREQRRARARAVASGEAPPRRRRRRS